VVALVDAKHLPLRLKDSKEAEDQIAFADVIVLNKTDLVSADELAAVEATVRAINPAARIHKAERSGVPLGEVLDRGAFDLKRALESDPHFLDADEHDHHGHDHHHGEASPIHDVSVRSISLRAGEMDPRKFFPWIEKTTQMDGPNILRLKGIIALKGDDERYVVQGVHMILEGDHQRPWKDGEKRESRLVFIGRDLDEERLRRTFEACQA
jgi:G3E family GTPase